MSNSFHALQKSREISVVLLQLQYYLPKALFIVPFGQIGWLERSKETRNLWCDLNLLLSKGILLLRLPNFARY